MSSLEDPAWWILLILELITLSLAILRTRYNKRVTEGSEKYWTGWTERSKDIAKENMEVIRRVQLACYLDTEGCISLHRDNSSLTPYIDFGNTSKKLVAKFMVLSNAQGSFEQRKVKGNQKELFRFRIFALEQVAHLLEEITPFLNLKKRQGELLLEYCTIRLSNYHKPLGKREWEIFQELKILNKRGIN